MFRPSLKLVLSFWIAHVFSSPMAKINRGLFVIQGVATCDQGKGYCLLSNSCSVDSEFQAGSPGDHCEGLKHGFNPDPGFVCCIASPSMDDEEAATVADSDTETTTNQEAKTTEEIEPSPKTAAKKTNQIIRRFAEIHKRVPFVPTESSFSDKSLLNVILFSMQHSPESS